MPERILVVDDEPDLLELVRLNLSQAGFGVDVAATGGEAMKSLQAARPDLVVLDLMLPDVSGTDLCRQLRSDPSFAELPIIMLTARADEVDRVVGFELGADDYVTKPFSPRELVLRVRAVLRRRNPSAAGSMSKVSSVEARPSPSHCPPRAPNTAEFTCSPQSCSPPDIFAP
jgi:DNA-binding response OmpR family regulator